METRRMCPNCRAFITTSDKVCPYCDLVLGRPVVEVRNSGDLIAGIIPSDRFVTSIILLINIGLYAAMVVHMQGTGKSNLLDFDGRTLFDFGAKFGPAIRAGQWWRLITAGFLHGGLFHIAMNSWVMWDLGAQVEENFGTPRYLLIYLFATFTGFFASFYWNPGLSIGASAGIFGLIGAMIALGRRSGTLHGRAVSSHYTRWAAIMIGLGLLPTGMLFGMAFDNAAHIGGLAGGFAIGWVAGTPQRTGALEHLWRAAGWISVAITLVCFFYMARWLMIANASA
ncbi:MAG: rhomboid family intramembrane serine protease [Bryobacteraceae bacterium]